MLLKRKRHCLLDSQVLATLIVLYPAATAPQEVLPGNDFLRKQRALDVLSKLEDLNLSSQQAHIVHELQGEIYTFSVQSLAKTRGQRARASGLQLSVVDGPARLRAGPSLNHAVIQLIPEGGKVRLISELNEWLYVLVQDQEGYVHRSLINVPPEEFRKTTRGVPPAAGSDAQARLGNTFDEYVDSFSSSSSFGCLDDLKRCESRHTWLDCQLVMVVCLGEAFIWSNQ